LFDAGDTKVDDQDGKYLQYSILFGNSAFLAMLIATFPASDAQTGNDIVQGLYSIYYGKTKKVTRLKMCSLS
jgi:hypothetical protein